MDHGHAEAALYPICILWAEARLVRERVNGLLATQMILTQAAIGSMFSKETATSFVESIERLRE